MRFPYPWRFIPVLAIILSTLVTAAGARADQALAAGGGAVVTTDWLNLRGGPGTVNPIVGHLSSGDAVRVLAGPVNQSWWRVTDGSQVGYVNGDWLAASASPSTPDVFDLDLSVPVHRQMTRIWCDPADLQSWLEYDLGQSLGDQTPVQQSFWDWELSHNAGYTVDQWDASPFAVASATLTHQLSR